MFELAWPWMLGALPLPIIMRKLLMPARLQTRGALRVPALDDFSALSSAGGLAYAPKPALWAALLGWVLLVLAAANPQWLGEPIGVPASGRDLMLAIDLSESMEVEDFIMQGQAVDRLTAMNEVARQFIERRSGDRIGLVVFGEQAYLHVPLTFDRRTVIQLLDETTIGLAGRSTAIGDAIGHAVKRLREQATPQKILILMTDGANTAGQVEPRRAAALAANAGLKIYAIGIGADEMLIRQTFGTVRVNPSTDLDEKTMRAIAAATGGRYFRARDVRELEAIYAELDRLEPIERGEEHFRPSKPLYPWPLAAAVLIAAGFCWRFLQAPR